jgi:Response regulator of the LytR/AlgR family
MRRIVICDDEEYTCQTIRDYLNRYQSEKGEAFSVRAFASGEELLRDMPRDTDILLLDIKMCEISGMEAARILRARHAEVCIIFITTMVQYALEGYEVHAFGFLKKPIVYEQFSRQMTEALHSLSFKEDFCISFRSGTETVRVSASDIYYIEAFGHNINVVTKTKNEKTDMSLSEFEAHLKTHGFFRCHKSYLVNHKYISRIEQDKLRIFNGDEVLISRHRRKEFLDDFTRYIGDRL